MSQTTHSQSSVYQLNGKPLSEEAIYRAKLKYGVYNNPAKTNLGVDPSASDTAALLASSTDLSITPYKRELASEAATAALIAKTDSAPKAWKRNTFAPEAEFAAISAKSSKFPFNDNSSNASASISGGDSADAASSVLKNEKNLARNLLQDLYDFDDIRSGKTMLSNNLNYNSQNSSQAYDHSKHFNIANISKLSTNSAIKSMNLRTNPAKLDYRSGLTTSNNFNTANGQVDIRKITSSAEASAKKSINSRVTRDASKSNYGIPTPSDNSSSFASIGALVSQQNSSPDFDYAARERETLTKNTLVDQKVLIKALQNANATISKIEGNISSSSFLNNKEMNLKAMQIAQENLLKRQANSADGKINLGAGLLLTPDELTKMAEKIVQPILKDIDSKVQLQRDLDTFKTQQQNDLKIKREEFKLKQKADKVALKVKREAEKNERLAKLQADKDDLVTKQKELTVQRQGELDDKNKAFESQIEEEEKAKAEIQAERDEKAKVISDEKSKNDAIRQGEVDAIQAEKDEILQPTLDELEQETDVLNGLIAKREEAQAFHDEHDTRLKSATEELESTNQQIEDLSTKIEELETKLVELREKATLETSESKELESKANDEFNKLDEETKELFTKKEALATEITDLETERQAKLSELTAAKQAALTEESEINALLPEHLQKETSDAISVESDIDHDQFKEDPLVESEPEVEEEEEVKEGEVTASTEGVSTTANAAAVKSTPSVPKKTWDEIKNLGLGDGMDPLKNIPTREKPSMTDIITDEDVALSQAKKLDLSAATVSKATKGKSSPSAASEARKEKKSGFLKKMFSSSSDTKAKPAPVAAPKKVYPKKKTVVEGKSTPAVAEVEAVEEPATEETETAPVEAGETAKEKVDDLFSNFSQGSDVPVEDEAGEEKIDETK